MTTDRAEQLRYYEIEAGLTASLSERMLDLAGVANGMRVLDIGTGRGEPALRAARRVGPEGYLLGVDVSEASLEETATKARHEGLSNLELRTVDAGSFDYGTAGFDAATARWSLMYMQEPEGVLAAVRRALEPHGTFVAALWAEAERVSWATLPRRVTGRFVTLPALDPEAPGPFRYASLATIEREFERAGFAIEHVEETDVTVFEAETAAGIVAWVRGVLPRFATMLSEAQVAPWEAELAREAEALRRGAMLALGGVTRTVVARARRGPALAAFQRKGP
jgi:ubiquinone/menaquinone biosynthesis C-methylase UbiE